MRTSVGISAVGHVAAIIVGLLFAGANLFDSQPTEAIAVDIISPSDVPREVQDAFLLGQDETGSAASPPAAAAPPAGSPAAPPPPASSRQKEAPARQKEAPAETRTETRSEAHQATPPMTPDQTGSEPEGPAPTPNPEVEAPDIGGLFGMPLSLPNGRLGGDFDAPAIDTAKIAKSSSAAFRDHLKSCTNLPATITAQDKIRIVMRISLKPDGTLASQPALIEASASPKGPAMMQSLIQGLRACQPYTMLPADQYKEWRVLDLSFTPQDLLKG
jgi:hypothetical protein